LNAREGDEFDERIIRFLQMKLGFSRILRSDFSPNDWSLIQKHVSDKFASDFIDIPNPNLKRTFIYQPYGSQSFPDLIVFTDKKVVPIEIKFSTRNQSKPFWNGHVPRASSFYIFGSYGRGDITFFCGNDVINPDHRRALFKFFDDITQMEDKIRENIPSLDKTNRGFTPYVRMAFGQKKHHREVNMSFFTHPERKNTEDKAIVKASTL